MQLSSWFSNKRIEAFLVGGIVRDALITGSFNGSSDIDITILGDATNVARAFATECLCPCTTHDRFLTATILYEGYSIDLVSARQETYPSSGGLPIIKLSTLEADLLRRDFSINACAYPLAAAAQTERIKRSAVLDPTGGEADIESKIIRILHPGSFFDDPTRIFRACRYASRYGFSFEGSTFEALTRAVHSDLLKNISPFRLAREVRLQALEPSFGEAFELWSKIGLINPHRAVPASICYQNGTFPSDIWALGILAELGYLPQRFDLMKLIEKKTEKKLIEPLQAAVRDAVSVSR